MKRKGTSCLSYVLALLCMLTAVSSSLASATLAKYFVSANVAASARVAKWDVKFTDATTSNLKDTAIFYIGSSSGARRIRVLNDSEVAAKITVKAKWDGDDATTGAASGDWSDTYTTVAYSATGSSGVISGSGRTVSLEPKGYAEFTVTVTGTTPPASVGTTLGGAANTRDTYRVEFYLEAEQID